MSTPYSKTSTKSYPPTSRNQNSLRDLMAAELHLATFESESLLAKHLPVRDDVVKSIIGDLRTLHQVSHSKLQYSSDEGMKPWPAPNDSECSHYEPLTWLLNTILHLSRGKIKKSFHARLNFFHYDRKMQEGADGDSPLKPDLVGCHRESLAKDEKVSWRDVEIAVEIKNRWSSMVTQATTYARCCFVFQETRKFITAILYNHAKMEVRIGLYTRSGLVVTESLSLSSSEGFQKFVRAISGIYARADAASAGIDASRTNGLIRIQNGDVYAIKKVLCNRRCVRGRGTRVYRIEKCKKDGDPAILPSQQSSGHPSSSRTDRYPLRSRQHRRAPPQNGDLIEDFEQLSLGISESATGGATNGASERLPEEKHSRVEDWDKEILRNDFEISDYNAKIYRMENEMDRRDVVVPDACILKEAWPLESHSNEGKMFKALDGKFGLPRVVCSYEITNGRGGGRTSEIIPSDATYWAVFSGEKRRSAENRSAKSGSKQLETIKPEVRIHKCIILDTGGISLLDAEGPQQLVKGIVHAMIGHYVLFKHGWLHRDVSIGNVMLMKEETREAVEDFDVTKEVTECIGFIGDGDQAIEWRNNERELAIRRSGTLPFMSMRLIHTWSIGTQVLHTAIDDLESFIWVLLWAILVILEAKGELTDPEEKWFLAIMRSDDIDKLDARSKVPHILHEQQATQQTLDEQTSLAPFRTLLIRLFGIADRASLAFKVFSRRAVKPSEELEGICQGFYKEYIEAGVDNLSALPTHWGNEGAD